jgi:outer membrane lipoprotein-sorting protein
MNCRKNCTLTIIFALIPFNLLLAIEPDEDLLEKFLERHKQIHTFQTDFLQLNIWPELDTEQHAEGTLYTKGNWIRMEYESPGQELMIGNDGSLLFYFPEEEQVIFQNPSYWQSLLSPSRFASEYINYCILDSMEYKQGRVVFYFTPTDEMSDFTDIVVMFSQADSLISYFGYKDIYDNSVQYNFSNLKINQEIPDSLFSFEVPKGVKIIDQRTYEEEP